MRKYTALASVDTQRLLGVLSDLTSSKDSYRDAMTMLGRNLAVEVGKRAPGLKDQAVCIACTVEDADFLATGLLVGFQDIGVDPSRLKLVCFWNERVSRFIGADQDSFDVAPIIKEYREVMDFQNMIVVVVKSIISGACVVKTNLATLLDAELPHRVIVAAPVMLEGAEKRLASEFPVATAEKFEYFTFAIDDEKVGDLVVPGIRGFTCRYRM